ncbi:hypothetical protein MAM1_0202d07900 [Mucor ambiguus]|uniref:Uncharacterized protein n=1 Tax=Mucor ambiguus TaxID=91626 RepID=A0A0C9MLJ0_9FUNG|nr:hypothetical protein MAM1_0202d07900 [Mucor ambiguus]
MAIIFGYEIDVDGHGARVVPPPLLGQTITVSSTENTNRWVFYGTRPDILDWMSHHSNMKLENSLFATGRPVTFHTHTEIVIDLLAYSDPEQSTFDYFKSFVATDFEHEKVKVEIRPRVESKDQMIPTLGRVIVASGVYLGDVLDELKQAWYTDRTFIERAKDLLNDTPGPVHIASTDAPMNIQVNPQ